VIHGLDVSKDSMRLISAALADGGFDVYAIDLPGHGDSRQAFQTDLAEKTIHNARVYLGQPPVLGHSLGAAIALDLASTEQFSALVLLSPPPIPITKIHADRILVTAGQFDVPMIRRFRDLVTDIGDSKAESWNLWGAHSAAVFNPSHIRHIVEWLGGDGAKTRTWTRIFWIAAMFVSSMVLALMFLPGRPLEPIDVSITTTLARYAVAGGVAVFILKFVNPLSWLRLFATDYLLGFILLTGLALILTGSFNRRDPNGAGPYIRAVIAAAFVIIVPGLIVFSRVMHISLSDGRLLRFPIIVAAALPLFISDELTIRRIQPRWKSAAVAFLTRALLSALILMGILIFNRQSGFLLMMIPLLVAFWMGLWFATGFIHRNAGNAIAAALFAALVQGWVFAALFVTT
jgi:pimeloyl-ACP methyl ester carboxylesterase